MHNGRVFQLRVLFDCAGFLCVVPTNPLGQGASTASVGRRSLAMSTMEASGAADVLADLDELDSVMGVETQDQQDLKPKQVCIALPSQL